MDENQLHVADPDVDLSPVPATGRVHTVETWFASFSRVHPFADTKNFCELPFGAADAVP
ncbi:hypothetical protein [Streptomyces sp. NPDC055681]